MINIESIREYMRSQANEDRKGIQVEGVNLYDALRQASIELCVPVKKIEYEITDLGRKGTFGIGMRKCVIFAYPFDFATNDGGGEKEDFDLSRIIESQVDKDGEVIVKLTSKGALISVFPPIGKGKKIQEKQVITKLNSRDIIDIDKRLLREVIKQADGTPVKIGDFIYNPTSDSSISIQITDLEMKAFITIETPGKGGMDIEFDAIMDFLKYNNIIYGINEDRIRELEKYPVYETSILIAEGRKPINGYDSTIIYDFDIKRTKIEFKEKKGRVDFKEQNLINNVVEGQVLARKTPIGEGKSGKTVTGKLIPANNGNDIVFEVGENVRLSDDGMTAIAGVSGQVMVFSGKLNVKSVYIVPGDVNFKTGGNIDFLGTVIIKGSVLDGFKVKAAGNIEVFGNVGKAILDAKGDIIVHKGINGKNGGSVRAGRSVWTKFLENAIVDAGEIVLASDGILNSRVDASKKIICQGKHATIVGGVLRASELIHAKLLGSVAGSETILEVGHNPSDKKRLIKLIKLMGDLNEKLDGIVLNINSIKKHKNLDEELSDKNKVYLNQLLEEEQEIEKQKAAIDKETKKISTDLSSSSVEGYISSSYQVFPGVKICIKDALLNVRNLFNAVTFINEDGLVKITKYEELKEDYSKNP